MQKYTEIMISREEINRRIQRAQPGQNAIELFFTPQEIEEMKQSKDANILNSPIKIINEDTHLTVRIASECENKRARRIVRSFERRNRRRR